MCVVHLKVDAKGVKLLAGFMDGVVRLLTLNKVDPSQVRGKKAKSNYELNLVQVFKPHTKPVTTLTIDDEGEILATGVSGNNLRWRVKIDAMVLQPLGQLSK